MLTIYLLSVIEFLNVKITVVDMLNELLEIHVRRHACIIIGVFYKLYRYRNNLALFLETSNMFYKQESI